MSKRMGLKVAEVGAVIAAVFFWIVPLRTGTQVLLFIGSIGLYLVCISISRNLADQDTGYWPKKPNQ